MQRITPGQPWPLLDIAASRDLERTSAAALPPHTLMQRAGRAVARLALALAPHARAIWIACGPGNNGGDGLEAAMQLTLWGKQPMVSWLGDPRHAPADALASCQRARQAGVQFVPHAPEHWDLCIDALLGVGARHPPNAAMAALIGRINAAGSPVLSVDLPSGLDADTGATSAVLATHTLSLFCLKPGLFTAHGRDVCGEIWFDDLEVTSAAAATSLLIGPPPYMARPHASHKGTRGDVAVIGGGRGMAGAALLAASAALHGGAGRVFAALLDDTSTSHDPSQPELMLRAWDSLDLPAMAVACGCGGGYSIAAVLPRVLSSAGALVLDADALNAIASDSQLQSLLGSRGRGGNATVLTPHPQEAARLLASSTAQVQANRLGAAQALAERYACVVVLKGSGTVIAAPRRLPAINPTGNARLATAGTGDVLAGMIAARLAAQSAAFEAACAAVYSHGQLADRWPVGAPLTASRLARGG